MTSKRGKTEVICGQGPAPAGATIKHYRDELGLDLIPGTGLLAACIPGTFDTWMMLLRDYGTMGLADVLDAGDRLCQERLSAGRAHQRHHRHGQGPVSRSLADLRRALSAGRQGAGAGHDLPQRKDRRDLRAHLARGEGGGGNREAEIERARKSWSQGFVAEAIDKFCRTQEVMDTSGERHRGVLTADDMARWQATRRGADLLRLRPLHRDEGRAVDARARHAADAWRCSRATTSTGCRRPAPSSSTCKSRRPSSPSPTARRSTAIRNS